MALKQEFDDWIRLPGKNDRRPHAAQLLSWSKLDHVHEGTPIQCNDGYHWRALLFLRKCDEQRFLYDLKKDFERIYDIRDNLKTNIHYSLESVRSISTRLEVLD